MIRVETCTEVTPELIDAMNHLIPQLSSSAGPLDADQLGAVVTAEASHLLIALDEDDSIVGSMTLVVFPIPTGIRAWVEDVVVDEAARGKGVGAALNTRALDIAREAGAKTVDLTSRPSREAANRLYQRLGFVPRETNVYRYDIT